MLILPAIDLIDGRCVRLLHGRFDQATRYGDPAEQLAAFAASGATWVHVVDLDGARAGAPQHYDLIARLTRTPGVQLQCGGGVRSRADIERLLECGVARVVIGSIAARDPETAGVWLAEFGRDRICCALDVRRAEIGYEVAADAWRTGAGFTLDALLDRFKSSDLAHVLITDISRDGAMTGPNAELIAAISGARARLQVQASGGVASLADLAALRQAGAAAAIVGRALYEGAFRLEDALAG